MRVKYTAERSVKSLRVSIDGLLSCLLFYFSVGLLSVSARFIFPLFFHDSSGLSVCVRVCVCVCVCVCVRVNVI